MRLSQTFPDNYGLARLRVAIAGRNRLDWSHTNWLGREQEVLNIPLSPFTLEEMRSYLEGELIYAISDQQVQALYERTEGRPILIGLTIDVLNHRTLMLHDLINVPKAAIESYLVPQVNRLEDPLNWVILFMAHVYHHFNLQVFTWLLHRTQEDLAQQIDISHLAAPLPNLSFVRRSSDSGNFALHDEMRRLVTKYCWEVLDPDRRLRKDLSRSVIQYDEQAMTQTLSAEVRQAYIVEILYHRLFIDLDDGLRYFAQQFLNAQRFLKTTLARLLLQEVQKFAAELSLAQLNDLQLAEVRLLRNEENPAAALDMLQRIRNNADPQWYQEYQADLFQEEGRCYRYQSKLQDAARCFMQCLDIQQAHGNEQECAKLLRSLGQVFRQSGQFSRALDYYEQSIALYRKLNLKLDYANTLRHISTIYPWQGKSEEALRLCKIVWRVHLELFQAGIMSELQVGLSLLNLGVTHLKVGNIIEAEQDFQEAFNIFLRMNYRVGVATTYNRFGQVQLIKGDLENAREWFIKAQEASHDFKGGQYVNSLNKQGHVCALQQQWNEAVTFFEQAIIFAQRIPDHYQRAESLIDLADALGHLEQRDLAQQRLQEAEALAKRENYLNLLGLIEYIRGKIYYKSGDRITACQHYALYCQYMAQYNSAEFNMALQKVVDALLDAPKEEIPLRVNELLTYWTAHKLDNEHPEFVLALTQINQFMFL